MATPYRTRATVLLPGALSYCVVHEEGHFDALCASYPLPADVMGGEELPDAVLWVLEEDPLTQALCDYRPFHLDFGPLTWMQVSRLLCVLQETRARMGGRNATQTKDRRGEHRRSRRRSQALRSDRDCLRDDEDTPSESDSDDERPSTSGECGRLRDADAGPMILVVVRLYQGLQRSTNLLAVLGVMSVLSGVVAHPGDIETYFPREAVLNWTVPFHDATPFDDVEAHFELTVEDTILGALYAFRLWEGELLDVQRFVVAHEYFQRLEFGDLSYIVPWRFVAFASPCDDDDDARAAADVVDDAGDLTPKPVSYYASIFGDPRGFYGCVGLVVQLNDNVQYNINRLKDAGVQHRTLFFVDGSFPTTQVVASFFDMVDAVPQESNVRPSSSATPPPRQRNAIALHCMAGLGRTGTLICLALMRDYGFSAKCAIAWARLCRPGSVIGPQQAFLCFTESRWKQSIFDFTILGTPQPSTSPAHSVKAATPQTVRVPTEAPTSAKNNKTIGDRQRPHRATHGISSSSRTNSTSASAPVLEVDRSSLVEVVINRNVSRSASGASEVSSDAQRPPPISRRTVAYRDAVSMNVTPTNAQRNPLGTGPHDNATPVLSRYAPSRRTAEHHSQRSSEKQPAVTATPTLKRSSVPARTQGCVTYTVGQHQQLVPTGRPSVQSESGMALLPPSVQSWLDEDARRLASPPSPNRPPGGGGGPPKVGATPPHRRPGTAAQKKHTGAPRSSDQSSGASSSTIHRISISL